MLDETLPVNCSIFLTRLICGAVPIPDLINRAAAYESASNSSFLDSPEMRLEIGISQLLLQCMVITY